MTTAQLPDHGPNYAIQNYLVDIFARHGAAPPDALVHDLVDHVAGWLQQSFNEGYDTAMMSRKPADTPGTEAQP